ncbi:hypothetical protein HHK36_020604 [Tetracentron sinense]|uniref:Uncharacterized protein n=1 Tax=Tetracentron sinense TaxID=13715 RepID=A0A835D8Z8_TETSI|nr:hypothetical protein HHK36_020604 [Tetracentron sinense]
MTSKAEGDALSGDRGHKAARSVQAILSNYLRHAGGENHQRGGRNKEGLEEVISRLNEFCGQKESSTQGVIVGPASAQE